MPTRLPGSPARKNAVEAARAQPDRVVERIVVRRKRFELRWGSDVLGAVSDPEVQREAATAPGSTALWSWVGDNSFAKIVWVGASLSDTTREFAHTRGQLQS